MIPQAYIAGAAAVILAVGGFTAGWKVNSWRHDSQALAIAEAAQKAGESATEAAVTAIKGIEVKYVTIKQQGETITRTEPVYVNCEHSPDGLRTVNQALAPGAAKLADRAPVVPGPDATPGR